MSLGTLAVPVIITFLICLGNIKKCQTAEDFAEGAKEGLRTAVSILPTLVLIMTAVGMFTASGAPVLISKLVSPLTQALRFPEECVPLALIRPVSGSGSLAALKDILSRTGPDSFSGLTACVLMSSTETTFYTIAVYYSALKKKPGGRIFIAAAAADISAFIIAPAAVRLFIG
ncbi:MAG: spore maturation protein [Ruminococcus sp.]|nr:spore maturation protein [Ruminococcus sp.]